METVDIKDRAQFRQDLEDLINKHSLEPISDTPDFMLADYLCDCLEAYHRLHGRKHAWFNDEEDPKPNID
jgi:hypothetical protein